MRYEFKDTTAPTAEGRNPEPGDEQFSLIFKLEYEAKLRVLIGRKGFVSVLACLIQQVRDDHELADEIEAEICNVKSGPTMPDDEWFESSDQQEGSIQ